MSVALSVPAATTADALVKANERTSESDRDDQCAYNIPAELNALKECLVVNSDNCARILCAHFNSVDRQANRIAPVSAVLCACHPTAIIGRIRAVVVYAVELEVFTESVRQAPFYKALRIFKPLVADENAATAVILITMMPTAITAVLYVLKSASEPLFRIDA